MASGDKAPTRPSYCHPWSDGVTPWLTHSLGGIQPLEPGYARYAALPHVSGRTPRVTAAVSTPHGEIAVEATRDNAQGLVSVTVDSPVAGVVGLRTADEETGCVLELATLTVDGRRATAEPAGAVTVERVHPLLASLHAYVRVPAGVHTVAAEFAAHCAAALALATTTTTKTPEAAAAPQADGAPPGFPVVAPYAAPEYPATWTVADSSPAGGNWVCKYGKAGYQLFAFTPNSSDVVSLPPWVHAVGGKNGGAIQGAFVGADASNQSFLVDPRGGQRTAAAQQGRALGFVTKGADGSQGTVLDVNVTVGVRYHLTLYMVSCVKPQSKSTWSFSRQAIRVMDLATLDPVAKDPLIQHAEAGVYWTLTYDRGVRTLGGGDHHIASAVCIVS